jgi:predicted nucleotidyltransferase
MFVNSDFSDLLQIFNANHVKYMVIGGYAVVQYAEPRFTKDLDVWISTETSNAEAVFKSLREFGAPLEEMSVKDFAEDGFFFQMGIAPIRVDILMGIPGCKFDECWQRRNEVDFDGLPVYFISKQDLIAAKRASGRQQDLMDADSLEKAG